MLSGSPSVGFHCKTEWVTTISVCKRGDAAERKFSMTGGQFIKILNTVNCRMKAAFTIRGMHQARQGIIVINKLKSRKLLSRNKQRHHSKAPFKNVSAIRYFMQHSSNSCLRPVKYTYSLYNEILSNQHKQFLNSHGKGRQEPGNHCLSFPAER